MRFDFVVGGSIRGYLTKGKGETKGVSTVELVQPCRTASGRRALSAGMQPGTDSHRATSTHTPLGSLPEEEPPDPEKRQGPRRRLVSREEPGRPARPPLGDHLCSKEGL